MHQCVLMGPAACRGLNDPVISAKILLPSMFGKQSLSRCIKCVCGAALPAALDNRCRNCRGSSRCCWSSAASGATRIRQRQPESSWMAIAATMSGAVGSRPACLLPSPQRQDSGIIWASNSLGQPGVQQGCTRPGTPYMMHAMAVGPHALHCIRTAGSPWGTSPSGAPARAAAGASSPGARTGCSAAPLLPAAGPCPPGSPTCPAP